MVDCPFCQIVAGAIPASVVAEASLVIAFLDKNPAAAGHSLVIPRRHVASLTDLSAAEAAEMISVAQELASRQKAVLPSCAGVTLALSDGEVAGQEVFHCHLHVIPRQTDDGFGWKLAPIALRRVDRAELDRVASILRGPRGTAG